MSFNGNSTSTILAYDGVNMQNPIDETLLIAEGNEKGFYLVDLCL
jgi:hypothetical protein